jgi:hypothetical protein
MFSETQFFTTADPFELFQALYESLNALKIFECQIDAKKLKLKYNCMVKIK